MADVIILLFAFGMILIMAGAYILSLVANNLADILGWVLMAAGMSCFLIAGFAVLTGKGRRS